MATNGTDVRPLDDEAPPHTTRPLGRVELILGALTLLVLSAAIRHVFAAHESIDYRWFLSRWWTYIDTHGGYRALRDDFADYNVPYLYVLTGLSYLTDQSLPAIKAVSVIFDHLLALVVFALVARWRPTAVAVAAALTVLLLPTVVLNSAMWAQCDSIYTTLGLAGLYFLHRERPWLACALFGAAYAFKQQAMFLLPVLLVLALRRQLPWRTLLAAPAAFLALDVPAALIGRPVPDLLRIYVDQTSTYGSLTHRAPSIYQFVDAPRHADLLRSAGILFAGALVLLLVLALASSRKPVVGDRLIRAATAFAIAMPFLLPSMHERYFYTADVLTVVVAFLRPRRLWYVPLLVQYASFSSYQGFLFDSKADLTLPAGAMLVALLAVLVDLARDLDLTHLGTRREPPATRPEPVTERVSVPVG